ncbi:hypothetical protein TVAG_024820 [Trichomonas vaginalis G3]|uniref:DUF3447 domain-containing protein n=1 Tax=Trichomonas vaginalis (strain ATCC PRA-98 / G3) TaxID=412133 RepID=A2FF58_TRIV3|nr:spectrin binding [Trichomonas vaginalis G3]EAX96471.1 hypothetical protein TVAG_024820 [Trichomonas vaginalis G3]KAI5503334.1 spectrin binding [Trichomonas vaginalis G3]|eukprot:XP_001309401.1 hypothetical protein [Trichomonas vaginalis G3]
MSSDYAKPYLDFIGAFDKLFLIKSNESVEDMCNIIKNVLISKYQLTESQLSLIILKAIQYNYASLENYKEISKNLSYEIKELSNLSFPSMSPFIFAVVHDKIDIFKEYITPKEFNSDIFLEIPSLERKESFNLSLIEACAYFGSVNIFNFLISNHNFTLSEKCLRCSLIGRNRDIINECLKYNQIDVDCLMDIVSSHNNEMFEFVLDRDLFTSEDPHEYEFIIDDIIKYQNLKAVFILFEREKSFIVPWCAAFPQTIDILKNEKLTNKIDRRKRNMIHYACMSQNSDVLKFLFDSTNKIDVDYHDTYEMTALHYATMYKNIDAARILISHGADVNAKSILFHFISVFII